MLVACGASRATTKNVLVGMRSHLRPRYTIVNLAVNPAVHILCPSAGDRGRHHQDGDGAGSARPRRVAI